MHHLANSKAYWIAFCIQRNWGRLDSLKASSPRGLDLLHTQFWFII